LHKALEIINESHLQTKQGIIANTYDLWRETIRTIKRGLAAILQIRAV